MSGEATILLVDETPAACAQEQAILENRGHTVTVACTTNELIEKMHRQAPQIILMSEAHTPLRGGGTLDSLKADALFGHVPVVLLLAPDAAPAQVDWTRIPVDDFLVRPCDADGLAARIRLVLARTQRDVNANPLTGLPGNVNIMREIERRLAAGQPLAFAYLDIDHFKPYNDKYGFSRGDEVLRMTARVLAHTLDALGGSETYVGHVGGDDFLFITPSPLVERACKQFLERFDLIVPNFYDEDDRQKGCIDSTDRQGNPRQFPLMTCTIAVVDTGRTAIRHTAELTSRAADVKRIAKGLPGSNYLIDRRK